MLKYDQRQLIKDIHKNEVHIVRIGFDDRSALFFNVWFWCSVVLLAEFRYFLEELQDISVGFPGAEEKLADYTKWLSSHCQQQSKILREKKKKICLKLRSLAQSLMKFGSLSAVKSGEVYIANVNGSLERSYIIRRPTPDTYSIYLIDKGMQCEAQFDDIYDFPPELLDFALFSCICPVFISSAEQLSIYKTFVGHKCRCEVETISRSLVVFGYIRGRLLVKNDDLYEDLQDIVYRKSSNGLKSIAKRSIRSNIPAEISSNTVSSTASGQIDDSSSSELAYRCSSTEKFAKKTRIVNNTANERNPNVSKMFKCGQQHGNNLDAELFAEYNVVKVETLFTQTAFKQYKPDVIPIVINVRFDKRDRTLGRFWVTNTSIFSTVERVLKDNAKRIAGFPLLLQRLGDDVSIREIPCIVRTRAESTYKTFYRAVPSRFDARTKRFSIFLVDFGWFKWVLANDVIDISAMDKSNPIRNLPVAMIHCQEDLTNVLHAQNLSKGTNCHMTVKGSVVQDVYLVDILETDGIMSNWLTNVVDEKNLMNNISSCKSLVCELCQQKLMASMMLGRSNTANHDLTAQPQHIWPFCCRPPFPVPVMPVTLPMMIPVPVANRNISTVEHLKFQNSPMRNTESIFVPEMNAENSAFTRSCTCHSSQNIQNEWHGNVFSERNRTASTLSDRAQNYFNEHNNSLSSIQASEFEKDHHMSQKNFDSNSYKLKRTSWEKAVAADRAILTQASIATEE
ncbi:Aspartyl/glutamyl-tRNA(Asn/Gln) amidotransferase subunit [Dirofilaria immitis]